MAGALDSLFKSVAKQVVADLGKSFDHTITYTRKASPTYNTSTGALTTTDTAYSFDVQSSLLSLKKKKGVKSVKLVCISLLIRLETTSLRLKTR